MGVENTKPVLLLGLALLLVLFFPAGALASDVNADGNNGSPPSEPPPDPGPIEPVYAAPADNIPPIVLDEHTIALYHADDADGNIVSDETGNFHADASSADIWDLVNKKAGVSSLGLDAQDYITQDTLLDNPPPNGTIELWMMPNESTGLALFSKINHHPFVDGQEEDDIYAYFRGNLFVTMWSGGEPHSLNSSTNTWNAGEWYHIAVTWGDEGFNLWVNGELEASNFFTGSFGSGSAADLIFGDHYELRKQGYGFNGKIDEIRISNIQRRYDDADGDGVPNDLDECPATPLGEPVDLVGCSCSQKVCDDGRPCTDDSCDWNSAACVYENDNTNVCGFERDCADSTCILKESPPYFFWKYYPLDDHDFCMDGNCMQYSCELISEDFNAECSFADTSELESQVDELEAKVVQLEGQNMQLKAEMDLLQAAVAALQQAFDNFVESVNAYLFNLPKGLRQSMICGALEASGNASAEGFGLHCEVNEKGVCNCVQI